MTHAFRKKTYPDHMLEEAMRERGYIVRVNWEIPGPMDTGVAWLVCYTIAGRLFIVETYEGGNGWTHFTDSQTINTDAAIEDVLAAIGHQPNTAK